MKSKILGLLAVVLLGVASWAQASIVYTVDRTVGAGTVTGFFETDGTIGVLGSANFLNWSLTLLAPIINGGVASTGSPGGGSRLELFFGGLSATATDILFDFTSGGEFYTFTTSNDFWCVAGARNGCSQLNAEVIGYNATGRSAYSVSYSGVQSLASVRVPEPGTLALLGLGLLGLGMSRRKA